MFSILYGCSRTRTSHVWRDDDDDYGRVDISRCRGRESEGERQRSCSIECYSLNVIIIIGVFPYYLLLCMVVECVGVWIGSECVCVCWLCEYIMSSCLTFSTPANSWHCVSTYTRLVYGISLEQRFDRNFEYVFRSVDCTMPSLAKWKQDILSVSIIITASELASSVCVPFAVYIWRDAVKI